MSTYPDFTRILNQKLLQQERSATWLAKRLDLHPGTVNRWLSHELRPATPELVVKIADLFNLEDVKERQALLASAGYTYSDRLPTNDTKSKSQGEPLKSQNNLQKHNLPPQPTTFVGREEELTQLGALHAQPDMHLLTIVGFGGVGKTRLAVEMATRLINDYVDGVWFVSLVGIDAASSQNTLNPLVMSLANVLSVVFLGQEEPEEQLLNYLQNKNMLLLFDNVEHLLNFSDFFSRLLSKCPQIKLLITSRERLRLVEEWLFPLIGLALPTSVEKITADTLQTSSKYDALQLFAQRACRVQPAFELDTNVDQVLHICQLVEGIPLGIELAAAWLLQMPIAQIASEIQNSSDFLHSPLRNQPERHRSFRTVFEHSWTLLTPDEQEMLMGLSVFPGGFRRPEAEAVTGATLQTLTGLVDKSFVRLNTSGRYEIHERIREYTQEKLRMEKGREKRLQGKHAQTYLRFLSEQGKQINYAGQINALTLVTEEIDNIRLAWSTALDRVYLNEIFAAQEAMTYVYWLKDWLLEGKEHLAHVATVLESVRQSLPEDPLHFQEVNVNLGLALSFLGFYYARTGFANEAKVVCEESLSILRPHETSEPRALAVAIMMCQQQAHGPHVDKGTIVTDLQKSHKLFTQVNDKYGQGTSLMLMGLTQYALGEIENAKQSFRTSLTYLESPVILGYSYHNLGICLGERGNLTESEKAYQAALHYWSKASHLQGLAQIYRELGVIFQLRKEYDEV